MLLMNTLQMRFEHCNDIIILTERLQLLPDA